MSQGDEGALAPREQGRLEPRAADADRERVAQQLGEHCAHGRLTTDELSQRVELAYTARTFAELEALTADLPVPPPPARQIRKSRRRKELRAFAEHAGAYTLTNGFLVGIWALTSPDGYFWPAWPLMGWGLGLAFHAMGALFPKHEDEETERKRSGPHDARPGAADRERRRAEHRERHRAERERRDTSRAEREEIRRRRREIIHAAERAALDFAQDKLTTLGGLGTAEPPARTPPATGKQWVSVLFTDIADSTRLLEALGDDDWTEVRRRHRELLTRAFEARGGTQFGSQGDGFMARFPTPSDAAMCAVDIQRELQRMRDAAGFAPKVRIGIHAGEVVEDEGDLVGKVLHLASRVTDEAEPGEIIVTEPVADQLGDRLALEDRGLRTLRGISQPRHLLAVRWS